MSPTICHDNESGLRNDRICEAEKVLNHTNGNLRNVKEESKDSKDRCMEQKCMKRKLSGDELELKIKKKLKNLDDDMIISLSSLSTNSDDYGTDTELEAINQNKTNKSNKTSYRYAPLNIFENLTEEATGHLISVSEAECNGHNSTCKNNFIISIDENDITSSTTHAEDIVKKIIATTTNANTKQLFDIAIETFKLMKKNQEFQLKLKELQSDTNNFISSIMENPENQPIKEQLKMLM